MKLLIFTQAFDRQDATLSVYHDWILAIAKAYEKVTIICLKKGEYEVPEHVTVLSLGKERGASRLQYVWNFYRYVFATRRSYDSVFVHMNQEYVLLGGLLWKMWGKKIYLWRNHHAGSLFTDIAAALCTRVFCTSKFSYTAKYARTVIMPVGIDTDIFTRDPRIIKSEKTILFLARIAPVKKPHVLLQALDLLKTKGITVKADIYGDPLPKDTAYAESLKQIVVDKGLSDTVFFRGGIPNKEAVRVYNEHDVFINLSSSGMYDKTIFEAMACESIIIASNKNLQGLIGDEYIFEEDNAAQLAEKMETFLALPVSEKQQRAKALRRIVIEKHSLTGLAEKLATIIS